MWPLDVYGIVAVRDSVDGGDLNIVFYRPRENCQTMNGKDQFLELVGPTRAVVVAESPYPVTVEVELKVRGAVESEDRCLSFVAAPLVDENPSFGPTRRSYTSKLSTVMFSFETVASSVEATVFAQVIEGSWPDGAHSQITALFNPPLSQRESVKLLTFGPDTVTVSADGELELSRRVVVVPSDDGFLVCLNAWRENAILAAERLQFKAAKQGRGRATLQFGTCQLEVIVAWSVVSPEPDGTLSWC